MNKVGGGEGGDDLACSKSALHINKKTEKKLQGVVDTIESIYDGIKGTTTKSLL